MPDPPTTGRRAIGPGRFILTPSHDAAQRLSVETYHGVEIDNGQDEVVDFADADHDEERGAVTAGRFGLMRPKSSAVATTSLPLCLMIPLRAISYEFPEPDSNSVQPMKKQRPRASTG